MAGEKTEAPTPKRIKDARQKGNVAKSEEIVTIGVLLLAVTTLKMLGPALWGSMADMLREGLGHPTNQELTSESAFQFGRCHVLRDRNHDRKIGRLIRKLRQLIERADHDFRIGAEPGRQTAAHARGRLGKNQLLAGGRDLCGEQRFAAGVVQHDRSGRGDVAKNVIGDHAKMHVAMQLAELNRVG